MNVKTSDIKSQFQFFTDYWNLYKKYYEIWLESKTDQERIWELLIAESDMILNAYKESDFYMFARRMIVELIAEFERKCKSENYK